MQLSGVILVKSFDVFEESFATGLYNGIPISCICIDTEQTLEESMFLAGVENICLPQPVTICPGIVLFGWRPHNNIKGHWDSNIHNYKFQKHHPYKRIIPSSKEKFTFYSDPTDNWSMDSNEIYKVYMSVRISDSAVAEMVESFSASPEGENFAALVKDIWEETYTLFKKNTPLSSITQAIEKEVEKRQLHCILNYECISRVFPLNATPLKFSIKAKKKPHDSGDRVRVGEVWSYFLYLSNTPFEAHHATREDSSFSRCSNGFWTCIHKKNVCFQGDNYLKTAFASRLPSSMKRSTAPLQESPSMSGSEAFVAAHGESIYIADDSVERICSNASVVPSVNHS